MRNETDSQLRERAPASELKAFLVERNYQAIGCDRWNTRQVKLLCARLGDTPAVMASRLRISWREFERRTREESWTKQDGLILTMLERDMQFVHAGQEPAGKLIEYDITSIQTTP